MESKKIKISSWICRSRSKIVERLSV